MTPRVSVCFVFFRSTTLANLDAAWYSLLQQDLSAVGEILVFDNNTSYGLDETFEPLAQGYQALREVYPLRYLPPVTFLVEKHGDPQKTHPYSVNRVCQAARAPVLFFTRADYLLDFSCLATLLRAFDARGGQAFVSGHCYQMAYDRDTQPYPPFDFEATAWRKYGPRSLVDVAPGHCFHETDQDAGVWLTAKASMVRAGWLNEGLSSWGFGQSTFQRALAQTGTPSVAIPKYLFFHMAHDFAPGARDFAQARLEYDRFGKGV